MCVATEVSQDLLRAAEGWLGVDPPVLTIQSVSQGCPADGVGDLGSRSGEVELPLLAGLLQARKEGASEELGKHCDRQEVVAPARHPVRPIKRQAAPGHDAMEVRMKVHVLSPCVQDSSDANVSAETLWVASETAQGRGCSPEEEIVDESLVA